MSRRALALLVGCLAGALAGCSAAVPPGVACESGGVRVVAQAPIRSIELRRGGLRVARRALPAGTTEAFVPVGEASGTVTARVTTDALFTAECTFPEVPRALEVALAVPAGQELRSMPDGPLPFVAFEGSRVELAVVITAAGPGHVRVEIDGAPREVPLTAPGQREIVTAPLGTDRPTVVRVTGPGFSRRAVLEPRLVPVEAAAAELAVRAVRFPTDQAGAVDVARPAGRVTLPGRAWTALLEVAGLGVRGRDRELPWAWHAVTLANAGSRPLDVVVRSRVLEGGAPAEAFRPVVRDADGRSGLVSALLRVPAEGEATAVLPLFVDEAALPEGASEFVHELSVVPLGAREAVRVETTPLRVSRGSSCVALGFALALLAACLGVGSAVVGVPRWLRSFGTTDLTTIAVFATLGFVITAATAVLSSGLAALLGPFSMLVTGLLSDCLRSALLATLIVLLPRRGTATLFLLLGWLMQGIALGAFSPTDFVFVGGRIFWLESFLWLAGLTRGGAWRDARSAARFARLTVGFAGSSLLSMAGSMASQIVLFRLYYAAWFVVLMLALPGFLYDVIACALATAFAASLREVQS